MEHQSGLKLGKEYDNAVFCHHVYLIYMENTVWERLGLMNHKPGRNIDNLRYKDDTTLMTEKNVW